jgi:hypothetical protein
MLTPPAVELAACTGGNPDTQAVAFVYGQQRNGTIVFGGTKVPMGIAYGEFGIVIPFVRYRRGAQLHAWVARMYSAYFPVVWDGNFRFGFAKEIASMSWIGSMFVMTNDAGALLFHAAVEPKGEWSSAAGSVLPQLATLREVFALPMLGRRPDGIFVRSAFDWDFTAALVRPAAAWLSLDAALVACAPALRQPPADGTTVAIRGMVWRLSWPSPLDADGTV